MSMQESVERLKNSRLQPRSWTFPVKEIKNIKKLLIDEADTDMVLVMTLGRDERGYYDLHYAFNDAETGNECGEGNSSCPNPPFPEC